MDFTDLMFYIIFDLSALFITITLIFNLIAKRSISLKSSKAFLYVLLTFLIFTIINMISILLYRGYFYFNINNLYLVRLFKTLSLFSLTIFTASYLIFFLYKTKIHRKFSHKNLFVSLFFIPTTISFILLTINLFNPIVLKFEIKDDTILNINYIYSTIVYVISLINISIPTIFYFFIKKYFSKKEAIPLFVTPIALIISVIVSLSIKDLSIEVLFLSSSLIFTEILLAIPEDLLDIKTGYFSNTLFSTKLHMHFDQRSSFDVVILKINNIHKVFQIYEYNKANNIIYQTANNLKINLKNYDKDIMPFAIDIGYYAYIVKKGIGEKVSNLILDELKYSLITYRNYKPDISLIVINESDFKDFNNFEEFVYKYKTIITKNNDIKIYHEIKDDKYFDIQINIKDIIDNAILNNEFEMYLQPIYSVKDNRFKSAEALVRLNSKKYGIIPPNFFIPYAEKVGLITKIDDIMFENVAKFVSSNLFDELNLELIEVNFSHKSCGDIKLIERIKNHIDKYNVDVSRINIEITESFDIEDKEIANNNVLKLKELGFGISLDDYGTGYSNLIRLINFPVNIIKIDKSLTDEVYKKEIEDILVTTFHLFKDNKQKSVVEGVENISTLTRVIEFGCDYIQGFYFSKPLPLNEFIEFIKSGGGL